MMLLSEGRKVIKMFGGFDRIDEKIVDFKPYAEQTMTFFLYEKEMEEVSDGK